MNTIININEIKRTFGFGPELPASDRKDIISIWRERIFLIIFISTSAIGIFIYVISMADTILKGWWVHFAVYTLGYLVIFCILIFRRIPFKIRAWAGSLVFFSFGVLSLMSFGMVGSGRVYLFAFSIVASLLLKMKGGVIALILNIIAMITVGWLAGAGLLGALVKIPYTTELWFYYTATFIWLNAIITISLAMLVQVLEESLTKEIKFVGELDAVNIELKKDIDTRKKIENALQESEEQFRILMEQSPIAIQIMNPDGRIVQVNNAYEKLWGITRKDLNEYNILQDKQVKEIGIIPYIEKAFEGETATLPEFEYDVRKVAQKGRKLWIRSYIYPVKGENGEIRNVVMMHEDITERKQAEIALQESEHRLLRAQEVANVGDWEFDVETGVSVWSDELYNIYGFNHVDEIKLETMLAGIHPDDRDYVNEMLAGWIENGEGEPFEYRIIRPYDGSIRHVYSPVEAVCDSNGNVVKIYGTALDITDRKNDEESLKIYTRELARSNKELKSLDKMKDEFLSNVSHELKTPLVSIKGFSEVMQGEMYGPLNEQQKKAMDAVIRNSERLGRLINSILYLTIQKSGKDKYAIHPVNITDIIGNALIDISPQINSKELTIENNTPSDLPLIKGDADKLTQVFINLLENATKFTPNGGKIIVAAFEDNENIHITVNDTGIGISADVISNLFERFYQVDASTTRKYGGTGIGLYISKLIVEVHKGKMWAEGEEGVGATFHVLLPK